MISLIILLLFYHTTVLLTRSEVVALVIRFLGTPNDIDMSVLLMKCTLFWYAQLLPLKTGEKKGHGTVVWALNVHEDALGSNPIMTIDN